MLSGPCWHRHTQTGTFSHLRGSFEQAYFFHITPDQISAAVDAVRMLRSDGSTEGTLQPAASFDRSDLSPREISFSNKGFPATWTFFQDTPIVRSRSCCATSAGALLRISSF